MMKRIILLAVLAVLAAGHTFAQDDSLSATYQDIYVRLGKEYAKEPDNVANLMEMASFFSLQENPYYSLTLAADYARRAEALYTAWVQDKGRYREMQRLIRKGINIPFIRQKRKDIEAQAVLYVRSHIPQIEEAEAKAFIKTFADNDEIVRRLNAKMVSDAFGRVCRENTVDGYYRFAQAYPNTVEADSAEMMLSKMAPRYVTQYTNEAEMDSAVAAYPASAALQQAAMRQKSRLAYLTACSANSVESYTDYLERYPRGDYYMDALTRLQQLRSADFDLLNTADELADYAERNSDDPLADSALARLRHMVTGEHSQKAAEVYLSRFPLDEWHSTVYKEYYGWYAEEGNRQPIQAFDSSHPDYPFRLSVASDLERAAIIDSVDLTRPYAEADAERATTGVRLLTGRKVAFVALQRLLQPQIVRRDWKSAKSRAMDFDICFEDVATSEYAELLELLTAGTATQSHLEVPQGDIMRVVVHPSGSRLYFNHATDSTISIGMMSQTKEKKGSKWQYQGDIQIGESAVTLYSFYDNGNKALLGIDGDIWSAEVTDDSAWTLLQHFGSPVNTPHMEQDAYMLADGSGMLLVSDRPGGMNVQASGSYYHGDHAPATDIYFIPCVDGRWGNAVNLGWGVNSPYCESSPIMSRNMRTLYFVTDARGLGYGDIYCATRTDIDDWTHWSEPVNLGCGVNGAFAEGSLSFAKGERSVFYTADVEPGGKRTCYSFATEHDTSNALRRVVVDLSDVEDVTRQLQWIDVGQQRSVTVVKESQIDSTIAFPLYRGKRYALLAEADWLYVPTLSIVGGEKTEAALLGYTLEELRGMDSIPLPLTTFHGRTAQMQSYARQELTALAHFMRQHAGCRIALSLHVDGADDHAAYTLSLQRGTAIRNYLVGCGIAAERIHIAAYGNVAYKEGREPSGQVAVKFL